MTREEIINEIKCLLSELNNGEDAVSYLTKNDVKWLNENIKALEPRKGEWLRMSDLSEREDDRYKCSRCGNVVHYTNKINLYTFNSWCGRCGSDNEIKIEVEE